MTEDELRSLQTVVVVVNPYKTGSAFTTVSTLAVLIGISVKPVEAVLLLFLIPALVVESVSILCFHHNCTFLSWKPSRLLFDLDFCDY